MEKPRTFKEKLKHAFAIGYEDEELSDADHALLEKLAVWVEKRGMTVPALMFLGTIGPLNSIGSQVMVFFEPFIHAFFNTEEYMRFAQIFEKKKGVNALIEKIENGSQRTEDRGQRTEDGRRKTEGK